MPYYSDKEILEAISTYMTLSENPDFAGYREQVKDREFLHSDRYMWIMRFICDVGGIKDRRVLDVGCGCGWQALTVAMIGNNSVLGCDILPSMIDGMSECIGKLDSVDAQVDLDARVADICELDLPDASFDAIYSVEAIEHVRELDLMFDNCHRLLKPGGSLVLVNDNNVLDRKLRDETIEMWDKRENSWEWANYLREIRPVEHGDARPFRVMREEIVKGAVPDISAEKLDQAVAQTKGLLTREIEAFVRNNDAGSLPRIVGDLDWCRNPETGEYAERLLDPYQLSGMLEERGFSSQVHHAFRRAPLNLFNNLQFRPLNTVLFNLRSIFVISAKKAS